MSLTCVQCKLLEHIVYINIVAHLDENLLSERQHAFSKNHSCETQLTTVINDWVKILDKGGQVDTLFWTSRKLLIPRVINFFQENYLFLSLAERHSGGWILFFAIEHNKPL